MQRVNSIKLTPPMLRSNNVLRRACLEIVEKAPPRAIVSIVAGAGSGKSTLLRQLHHRPCSTNSMKLWVSLDSKDASLESLWTTVTAAFDTIDASIARPAMEHFNAYGAKSIRDCVDLLCNGIDDKNEPVELYIDDFHFACKCESSRFFHCLVDAQPANLKLYLATRLAPDLPIDALRVDNRMIELSWEHLNFSSAEAQEFFEGTQKKAVLTCEAIDRIHQETEGWAAGLQLALLKSQLTSDREVEVSSLPGLSQDVSSYFRTEIYSVFPGDVQHFLRCTSVLDRMNDSVAAHVAGVDGKEADRIFRFLDDQGFFIIALDEKLHWKRYHHLFQEFLGEIRDLTNPDAKKHCQKAASIWFEQNGFVMEAIEYSINAEDFERACDLVEMHAINLFKHGAVADLATWIRRVPDSVTVRRPQLPLYLCLMYAHMRQPVEGMHLQYEKSKQIISTLNAIKHFEDQEMYDRLNRELEAVSVIIQFRSGEMSELLRSAETVLGGQTPLRGIFAASLYNVVGYAHFTLGDSVAARKSLAKAREEHLREDSVFGVVFAECFTGIVEFSEGRAIDALSRFESARDFANAELGEASLPSAIASLYLLVFQYEQNAISLNDNELGEVLTRCYDCCEPEIYASGLVVQYRISSLAGQKEKARDQLNMAINYARKHGNPAIYLQVKFAELAQYIGAGEPTDAMRVFDEVQAVWSEPNGARPSGWGRLQYWRDLFRAEILQATARPREAIELLESLASQCQLHNRQRRFVYVSAKLAIAQLSAGESSSALYSMKQALLVAKEGRFFRTLLDIGAPIIDLLRTCQVEFDDTELIYFVEQLIAGSAPIGQTTGDRERVVLQELTEQELDILRLLVTGAKNKEISQQLSLAENTIKWYLGRIFEKLGASNRTEAALIAKSLFAAL